MFTSPKDLASLEMTCNWMRSSRVMSRVVKRKLDGHLSECGFEDPNTNARKTKEQVMKQLIPRENDGAILYKCDVEARVSISHY